MHCLDLYFLTYHILVVFFDKMKEEYKLKITSLVVHRIFDYEGDIEGFVNDIFDFLDELPIVVSIPMYPTYYDIKGNVRS